jgi:hypothetical protein
MLASVQDSETSSILDVCMLELRGYNWTQKKIFSVSYSMITDLLYRLIGAFRVELIKCTITGEQESRAFFQLPWW